MLDCLGSREPDQRQPDPANACDVGVRLNGREEVAARERGVVVPEVRPGNLREDPGFLAAIADRFERGEDCR